MVSPMDNKDDVISGLRADLTVARGELQGTYKMLADLRLDAQRAYTRERRNKERLLRIYDVLDQHKHRRRKTKLYIAIRRALRLSNP